MTDNLPEPRLPQSAVEQSGPTVAAALQYGYRLLSDRLDVHVLLAHVLHTTRAWLLAHDERQLTLAAWDAFRAAIVARAAGTPVAYLTGEREFWSLRLRVDERVLIPRPETELLVERCLDHLGALSHGAPRVADLGTGSGAVALALAVECPRAHVVATDQSDAALQVAQANAAEVARSHPVMAALEWRLGRWYEAVPGLRFDIIASNPPYVAAADPALASLEHEPRSALVSGTDGLDDLRHLIALAPQYLLPGGWLVLEHGSDQAPAVAAALVAAGARSVRCHVDLAGLPRVSEGQW